MRTPEQRPVRGLNYQQRQQLLAEGRLRSPFKDPNWAHYDRARDDRRRVVGPREVVRSDLNDLTFLEKKRLLRTGEWPKRIQSEPQPERSKHELPPQFVDTKMVFDPQLGRTTARHADGSPLGLPPQAGTRFTEPFEKPERGPAESPFAFKERTRQALRKHIASQALAAHTGAGVDGYPAGWRQEREDEIREAQQAEAAELEEAQAEVDELKAESLRQQEELERLRAALSPTAVVPDTQDIGRRVAEQMQDAGLLD